MLAGLNGLRYFLMLHSFSHSYSFNVKNIRLKQAQKEFRPLEALIKVAISSF